MKPIITPDHHSVKNAPNVLDICYNFFKNSNITAFVYARIFDCGETYGLNSNAEWQLYHFNDHHLVTPPIPRKIINKRCSFILSSKTAPKPFVRTLQGFRNILAMDYPYFMIERYQTYYDLFVFCTHIDNEDIINFHLNEQSYLEKFKQYFKSKAKNLLKDAKRHKIIIPEYMQPKIDWHNPLQRRVDFPAFNYSIFHDLYDIEFTMREAECLKYLANGYSAKYIAKVLKISPRTVEFHVGNIKNKMCLNTISEVLIFIDEIKAQVRNW